jgi:hypothetical protein
LDAAHLTRPFRRMLRTTPSELVRRQEERGDAFVASNSDLALGKLSLRFSAFRFLDCPNTRPSGETIEAWDVHPYEVCP